MSKRKTPGLNTGAMSDISFLLLTFFLLTSSINTEQGIPRKHPSLPEKVSKPIDGIGDFAVSKGVVSLTNDQGTSYNMYVQVQNELQRAVNELRDETSLQYFGKKYSALDSAAQRAVTAAIPMIISEAPPMDYSKAPAQ